MEYHESTLRQVLWRGSNEVMARDKVNTQCMVVAILLKDKVAMVAMWHCAL